MFCGVVDVFVSVCAIVLPLPADAFVIFGLVANKVHAYVVPGTEEVNAILVCVAEQIV